MIKYSKCQKCSVFSFFSVKHLNSGKALKNRLSSVTNQLFEQLDRETRRRIAESYAYSVTFAESYHFKCLSFCRQVCSSNVRLERYEIFLAKIVYYEKLVKSQWHLFWWFFDINWFREFFLQNIYYFWHLKITPIWLKSDQLYWARLTFGEAKISINKNDNWRDGWALSFVSHQSVALINFYFQNIFLSLKQWQWPVQGLKMAVVLLWPRWLRGSGWTWVEQSLLPPSPPWPKIPTLSCTESVAPMTISIPTK